MDFQTILLTGGTGSFGQAMTRFLLTQTAATIRVYSRGELLQSDMASTLQHHPRLRFLLGDVRDFARLQLAMDGVDLVLHAAALKQVPSAEYNVDEVVATNIVGTQNVVHAARNLGVPRVIFLSSDKAAGAINTYGVSKAMGERLMIQANGYAPHKTSYSCIRYGNVHSSRGSVTEVWGKALRQQQPLRVTDLAMTRFYIDLEEAVALAWFAAVYAPRGSILVPHLPAYTMHDLLQALCLHADVAMPLIDRIGIRPGEKCHERLITEDEAQRLVTYREDAMALKYYCILPAAPSWEMLPCQAWPTPASGVWQPEPLLVPYTSDGWPYRLGVETLRQCLEGEAYAHAAGP